MNLLRYNAGQHQSNIGYNLVLGLTVRTERVSSPRLDTVPVFCCYFAVFQFLKPVILVINDRQ